MQFEIFLGERGLCLSARCPAGVRRTLWVVSGLALDGADPRSSREYGGAHVAGFHQEGNGHGGKRRVDHKVPSGGW
jgi:hypothetical protein